MESQSELSAMSFRGFSLGASAGEGKNKFDVGGIYAQASRLFITPFMKFGGLELWDNLSIGEMKDLQDWFADLDNPLMDFSLLSGGWSTATQPEPEEAEAILVLYFKLHKEPFRHTHSRSSSIVMKGVLHQS